MMGKGGGGGSSGKSYPVPYVGYAHGLMIAGQVPHGLGNGESWSYHTTKSWPTRDTNNLYDSAYAVAAGDSPYTNKEAYDPGTLTAEGTEPDHGDELYRMQSRLKDVQDELFTGVDIDDPSSGTAKEVTDVWNSYGLAANNAAWIDDVVSAFETKSLPQHLKSINRIGSLFAANNATGGTAFVMARALLEDARTKASTSLRAALVGDSIKTLVAMRSDQIRTKLALADLQVRVGAASITAKMDQARVNLDYEVMDLTWDMDTWLRASNILGASQGAVMSDTKDMGPSRAQSAISGALMGGATGAFMFAEEGMNLGGVQGPVGAAIGAVIGGLAGLLT